MIKIAKYVSNENTRIIETVVTELIKANINHILYTCHIFRPSRNKIVFYCKACMYLMKRKSINDERFWFQNEISLWKYDTYRDTMHITLCFNGRDIMNLLTAKSFLIALRFIADYVRNR